MLKLLQSNIDGESLEIALILLVLCNCYQTTLSPSCVLLQFNLWIYVIFWNIMETIWGGFIVTLLAVGYLADGVSERRKFRQAMLDKSGQQINIDVAQHVQNDNNVEMNNNNNNHPDDKDDGVDDPIASIITDHCAFMKPYVGWIMPTVTSLSATALNYFVPMGYAKQVLQIVAFLTTIGGTAFGYWYIIPKIKRMVHETIEVVNNSIHRRVGELRNQFNTNVAKIKMFFRQLWLNNKESIKNLGFVCLCITSVMIGIFVGINTFSDVLITGSFIDPTRYQLLVLQQSLTYVWYLFMVLGPSNYHRLKECAFGVFVTMPVIKYLATVHPDPPIIIDIQIFCICFAYVVGHLT